MKKAYLILITTVFLLSIFNLSHAAQPREQSSVLLIFNNQSHKRYNDKLTAIAEAELNKKVHGIYKEIDPMAYKKIFTECSFETVDTATMQNLVQSSQADYFVYTELLPYTGTESFDLIYRKKSMTATMLLRIFDLKNSKELFNAKYALTYNEAIDHLFIGNPSVAKKSLQMVLFKIGEAISVNLPL